MFGVDDDVNDLAVVLADRGLDRGGSGVRLRQCLAPVKRDSYKRNDAARLAMNTKLQWLVPGQVEDNCGNRVM